MDSQNQLRRRKRGKSEMENSSVKSEAHRLVDELPENATWDDLMYRIYVRQAIEAGVEDSRAGRVIPDEEVWKEFGLS
jgi:predicted transcriptional regulator